MEQPGTPAPAARALAARIAARLGEVPGVVAVALGGSHARGRAAPDSDLDLGIYYWPAQPPDLEDLRELARELDHRSPPPEVTPLGAWGPWVNGGCWLRVEGSLSVDWLYRDLERVTRTIEDCLAGQVTCDYYLGHPHGFHNHIYLGEVHHAQPLHDPSHVLDELRARLTPYPHALRRELVRRYLYDAEFMLELAHKPARRGDVFHVAGCAFRVVAALLQVLFALNETYFTNEKGALAEADAFALRPEAFGARVGAVLVGIGPSAPALADALERLEALLAETRRLADPVRR